MNVFSSALDRCVLRYLKLSDKAMGEKGVNAFGSLMRSQNTLEEPYLMNVVVSLSIVSSRMHVILADETYATKTDALETVMHAAVHFQGSLTFVCNRYQLLILAVMYIADEDLESITNVQ
ncbi:unnamed protein product [Malus baccata var. baccata]